ncbi:MAG TPA: hypothetical protein VN623_04720 [Hyphomicrobium sp.]|jgi:hypothetical protein|uniref:hypothetical protein n=1 Tax=Hyphomicrobium sp. TaxID=82 RepID=UPI002C85560D|nr:hypothetical protein [Hyphomicrobium sp.]HXE01234.1 hypothetical protein [Hyphomicrobium sp.]
MLRRYLIVNGTMTLLLYGAFFALVPSAPNLLQSVRATFDAVLMESPILGPLVNRIILVSGNFAG